MICSNCDSVLVGAHCPHCLAPASGPSRGGRLAALGLALALGPACVTSQALYGVELTDDDQDGFFADLDDCDDTDASIHPDADDELGDGIDQNCDGVDGIAESEDTGDSGDTGE